AIRLTARQATFQVDAGQFPDQPTPQRLIRRQELVPERPRPALLEVLLPALLEPRDALLETLVGVGVTVQQSIGHGFILPGRQGDIDQSPTSTVPSSRRRASLAHASHNPSRFCQTRRTVLAEQPTCAPICS